MNKLNHWLYVSLYFKYGNNVIPQIPRILLSYLIKNPTKKDLYLNKNIKVEQILIILSDKYKDKRDETDILSEIIDFVEVRKCMMT